MNKKCICTNQKNEPCPWQALKDKLYCKRHSIYDGIYNESELPNIKKCSTCKMYMMPEDNNLEFSTCTKCRLRGTQIREIEKQEINEKCLGKCNNGKLCDNKPLENDTYCKLHQSYKKYNEIIDCGKKICKNYVRGCWNEINDTYERCINCREKERENDKKLREKKKNNSENYNLKKILEKNPKLETKIELKPELKPEPKPAIKIESENNIEPEIKLELMCYKCNKIVEEINFKYNQCISCYNLQYKCDKNRNERDIFESNYYEYKRNAKRRDLEFKLTKEECIELFKQVCYYCGILETINGIDRINSNQGYFTENCVSCCKQCNFMKNDKEQDKFIKLCEHIATYNNKYKGNLYNEELIHTKFGNYSQYKYNASKRNIDFNLLKKEFINLISEKCYYCGTEGLNEKYNTVGAGGIDRIDSSISYTINNCVSCCGQCNEMKLDYTKKEFLDKCLLITKYNNFENKDDLESEIKEQFYKFQEGKFKLIKEKFLHSKEYYLARTFNSNIDEVKNIKIKLLLVNDEELKDLWNYYRKYTSSLKKHIDSQYKGRRFEILVQDEISQKYLGILALCSDSLNYEARDKYIEWSNDEKIKNKKINYLMNIATCVSLQPFGFNFNGGKLLTKLVFSQEIQDIFKKKYDHDLLGITTTGLYGKSIQYDRLKEIKFIGYTKGNSVHKYPNDFVRKCHNFLKIKYNIEYKTRNKLHIISSTLQKLNLPKDEFMQDNPKGIYFGFIGNSKNFLNGKEKKFKLGKLKSCNEIFNEWLNRWAIQRSSHLIKEKKFIENNIVTSTEKAKKSKLKLKEEIGEEEYNKRNREKVQKCREKKKQQNIEI
jgi:hypothetical protein